MYLPVTVEGGPVGSILSVCTGAMGPGKGGVVLCCARLPLWVKWDDETACLGGGKIQWGRGNR